MSRHDLALNLLFLKDQCCHIRWVPRCSCLSLRDFSSPAQCSSAVDSMTTFTVVISPKTTLAPIYRDASVNTIQGEAVLVTTPAIPPASTDVVTHYIRSGPGGLSPRAAGAFLGAFLGGSALVVFLVYYCCIPRRRHYRSETSSSSRSSTSSLIKLQPQTQAGLISSRPNIQTPQDFSVPLPPPSTAHPFGDRPPRSSGKKINSIPLWLPKVPKEPIILELPAKDRRDLMRREPGTAVAIANKKAWVKTRPKRPDRVLPPAGWDPPPE